MTEKRLAVVLMNLGGPDSPEAVEPFLRNLFSDPAIIRLPSIVRKPLAWFIARRRAPVAREIYGNIGNASPLLPETISQADALKSVLVEDGAFGDVSVFIAMRYWHPFAEQTVREVADFRPDRIVLLPLYPQYSTTTSASSLRVWKEAASDISLTAATSTVCCYFGDERFIDSHAALLRDAVSRMQGKAFRILFSAHGLPKRIVEGGDPYQWQVERTARLVMEKMGDTRGDWRVCYQSRVGPLEWIGPSTEEEIREAGREGLSLIVVPIAFVSEHSETLVELDIEYRDLARESGVPAFDRVPTLSTHESFIAALSRLAKQAAGYDDGAILSFEGPAVCPPDFSGCPCLKRVSQ